MQLNVLGLGRKEKGKEESVKWYIVGIAEEVKAHILLIGLGNIRRVLVPALRKLEGERALEVTCVDTKNWEELVNEPPSMSREEIEWTKQRFMQDDKSDSFLAGIERRSRSAKRRIAYLAIPPSAYPDVIVRYLQCADVFIIEKPWAEDSSHLQQLRDIQRNHNDKKILGSDHYLWKAEVRQFLGRMRGGGGNTHLIEAADSFDLVLCESELEPVNRSYFWKTGMAIDMSPHVLTFLYSLFPNCEIKVVKVEPAICEDEVVFEVIRRRDESEKSEGLSPVKETYAEILLNVSSGASNKEVHVVLGKGVSVGPIHVCNKEIRSSKFFYGAGGRLFLDLANHECLLDCSNGRVEPGESEWYDLLDSLVGGAFERFIDISSLSEYVGLFSGILDKIDQKVRSIQRDDNRDLSIAQILLTEERFRYRRGDFPRKIEHRGCCFP